MARCWQAAENFANHKAKGNLTSVVLVIFILQGQACFSVFKEILHRFVTFPKNRCEFVFIKTMRTASFLVYFALLWKMGHHLVKKILPEKYSLKELVVESKILIFSVIAI